MRLVEVVELVFSILHFWLGGRPSWPCTGDGPYGKPKSPHLRGPFTDGPARRIVQELFKCLRQNPPIISGTVSWPSNALGSRRGPCPCFGPVEKLPDAPATPHIVGVGWVRERKVSLDRTFRPRDCLSGLLRTRVLSRGFPRTAGRVDAFGAEPTAQSDGSHPMPDDESNL